MGVLYEICGFYWDYQMFSKMFRTFAVVICLFYVIEFLSGAPTLCFGFWRFFPRLFGCGCWDFLGFSGFLFIWYFSGSSGEKFDDFLRSFGSKLLGRN